jgi:hypothetical protein
MWYSIRLVEGGSLTYRGVNGVVRVAGPEGE